MTTVDSVKDQGLGGFIRRRPILAFCLWFFPVGWVISFFPIIAEGAWGAELPFQPFAIGMQVWGLVGLLLITRLVDGPDGLRDLARRSFKVVVPLRWYAVVLLALPVPALLLALAFLGPPEASASTWISAIALGFLLQTVITFLTVNFIEEVTWMGFVQARLQQRGVMFAVLVTALLFALQHLALFVGDGGGRLILFPVFFLLVVGFRALQGFVYNHTGSVFIVGLLHAASNGATGGSGFGEFGEGLLPRLYDSDVVGMLHLLSALLVGLVLIAVTRGRLGYPEGRSTGSQLARFDDE